MYTPTHSPLAPVPPSPFNARRGHLTQGFSYAPGNAPAQYASPACGYPQESQGASWVAPSSRPDGAAHLAHEPFYVQTADLDLDSRAHSSLSDLPRMGGGSQVRERDHARWGFSRMMFTIDWGDRAIPSPVSWPRRQRVQTTRITPRRIPTTPSPAIVSSRRSRRKISPSPGPRITSSTASRPATTAPSAAITAIVRSSSTRMTTRAASSSSRRTRDTAPSSIWTRPCRTRPCRTSPCRTTTTSTAAITTRTAITCLTNTIPPT